MKKLILPLVLLLVGVGAGVAAGLSVAPPLPVADPVLGPCGDVDGATTSEDMHVTPDDLNSTPAAEDHGAASGEQGALGEGFEYVRLNNQFVVPVVEDSEVSALVILSISVEVPTGQQEAVLLVEPKLRDVFLQVLFDHANMGGFAGMYTASENMRSLRNILLKNAQDTLGDMISDVLIVEIVRQDV